MIYLAEFLKLIPKQLFFSKNIQNKIFSEKCFVLLHLHFCANSLPTKKQEADDLINFLVLQGPKFIFFTIKKQELFDFHVQK